jgi:hypothetical protein
MRNTSRQVRQRAVVNAYRVGIAVGTIVAFIGTVGAPIKWD